MLQIFSFPRKFKEVFPDCISFDFVNVWEVIENKGQFIEVITGTFMVDNGKIIHLDGDEFDDEYRLIYGYDVADYDDTDEIKGINIYTYLKI